MSDTTSVDEAFYRLAILQRDQAWREIEDLKLELGKIRLCVNCGRTRPADEGKDALPGCIDPESGLSACTWDATPREALEFWRAKAHQLQQDLQQQIKFRKLGY